MLNFPEYLAWTHSDPYMWFLDLDTCTCIHIGYSYEIICNDRAESTVYRQLSHCCCCSFFSPYSVFIFLCGYCILYISLHEGTYAAMKTKLAWFHKCKNHVSLWNCSQKSWKEDTGVWLSDPETTKSKKDLFQALSLTIWNIYFYNL